MKARWRRKKTLKQKQETILGNGVITLEILVDITKGYLIDLDSNANRKIIISNNSGQTMRMKRYKDFDEARIQ